MSLPEPAPEKVPQPPARARRRARWFRRVGIGVLLMGFFCGSEVYRRSLVASADVMDDPEMSGFNRQEVRQMGMLYGTQGTLILEMEEALGRPKNQMILILIASVLLAGGCWYVAKLLDHDAAGE